MVGKDPYKLDSLCPELGKHNLSLCAISEHRWRGEGTYKVDEEWLFLFSGLPMDAEKAMQGVGFLLNQQMQAAWKAADSLCECAGGRLIRIRLKIRGRFFSVIWCYAPTYRCSDEEKDQFYAKLGRLLNEIPARDDLILLGDFNARVGLALEEREEQGPVVREMVGTRGLPERNDNGVRLLDFCSGRVREKLCIASTFYKRREYGTWFHQSSRRWYQIDHVICSRQTKSLVTDVCAMPGYVHETDHRCLRLQFAVPPKAYLGKFYRSGRSARQEVRPPRLLVSGLKVPEVARDFNEQLHSLMVEGFFDEGYELFGYALRKVAHKCLGAVPVEGGPQWKLDNAPKLARTKGGWHSLHLTVFSRGSIRRPVRRLRTKCSS